MASQDETVGFTQTSAITAGGDILTHHNLLSQYQVEFENNNKTPTVPSLVRVDNNNAPTELVAVFPPSLIGQDVKGGSSSTDADFVLMHERNFEGKPKNCSRHALTISRQDGEVHSDSRPQSFQITAIGNNNTICRIPPKSGYSKNNALRLVRNGSNHYEHLERTKEEIKHIMKKGDAIILMGGDGTSITDKLVLFIPPGYSLRGECYGLDVGENPPSSASGGGVARGVTSASGGGRKARAAVASASGGGGGVAPSRGVASGGAASVGGAASHDGCVIIVDKAKAAGDISPLKSTPITHPYTSSRGLPEQGGETNRKSVTDNKGGKGGRTSKSPKRNDGGRVLYSHQKGGVDSDNDDDDDELGDLGKMDITNRPRYVIPIYVCFYFLSFFCPVSYSLFLYCIISSRRAASNRSGSKPKASSNLQDIADEDETSLYRPGNGEDSEDEELELSFTKKQKKQKKKRATPKKPSLSARCDAFTKEVVALKSEDFNVLLTSLDMNRVRLLVHFTYSVSNDDC